MSPSSRKHPQGAGSVYLIGAGPGDPKLLTVRGLELLRRADVVIYDRLASRRLLREAPEKAELLYVGKTGHGRRVPQSQINSLLVEKAREGKTVIRLKGGDAFIFGRGGEEAEALAEAQIPFEVVPGVSSGYAVPAYAGIPVTHRSYTSDVAFLTGHEEPAKVESRIRWDRISGFGTLVFLMAMKNLPMIVARLIEHGKSPDTSVALVRWGTTPRQETITGTLADIAEKAAEAGFKAPVIAIIGEVVRLREKLAWYEKKPLFGKRILITRSGKQANIFLRKLEDLGAEPLLFPMIETEPLASTPELDQALRALAGANAHPPYQWAIFTSGNAVEHFLGRLSGFGVDVRALKGVKLAAIGPATARKLRAASLSVDYIPEEHVAEAALEGLKSQIQAGDRILIPRAREARDILPDGLREVGCEVTVAPVYETVPATGSVEKLRRLIADGIDYITFTSSSTVRNFARILSREDLRKLAGRAKVVTIGPITSETVQEIGLEAALEADPHTVDAMIEAMVADTSRERGADPTEERSTE